MLCRTANELYWMARHIERAENTARLLDVTYRTSLLPYEVRDAGMAWAEPWSVPLITSGLATSYYEHYAELTAESVLKYMILDASNPSSIFCCLRAARESARSVRGASPASTKVGQVDSASVGCAMYFSGDAMIRARNASISAFDAAGPISMP